MNRRLADQVSWSGLSLVVLLTGLGGVTAWANDSPAASATVLPGVSARALMALPERVTARVAGGRGVAGPSEQELRRLFLSAVEVAIDRSPAINGARARQQAANEDIAEAQGRRWPQVDIGAQSRARQFGSGQANDYAAASALNLSVTTSVFDWGALDKTIGSRRHMATAAQESIEAELERSAFDVVTALIELGKQRVLVDLGMDFVSRMQELVRMLAEVVAVDAGRSSELTQAKARLLQAQAALEIAESRVNDVQLMLRKLMGERTVQIPRAREWNLQLVNLDSLLADVDAHPLVLQAAAIAQAADLQAEVVRASSLPQFNWVINKSTREDALGREQPWQTSLSLNWTVFRGGSVRAAERAALQRAEVGRQEMEQQQLDLQFRLRTAHQDAYTMLERAELYRELALETDRIRQAFFEQWYHLGKRTLLDVLSAETDHYGNQVSEVSNRFDGYHSIVHQYASAGSLVSWLRGHRH